VPEEEAVIYRGRIRMPYTWAVGETGSFFLTQLRDHARIWGTRCPQCRRTMVPPRRNCPRCLAKTHWLQLEPRGSLVTYTVVHYRHRIHPPQEPLIYGVIKLEGADTGLTHLLGEVDPADLRPGLLLEAVFKEPEQRRGHILDILYFRPREVTGS